MKKLLSAICILFILAPCAPADVHKADVCIYGGTSAAVALGQVCGFAAAIAGRNPVQDVDVRLIQEEVGYGKAEQ